MKNIVVLGSDGLVGKTVFKYLQSRFKENVWGTSRNKDLNTGQFYFQVENLQENFLSIYNKLGKIDYVINCIGLVDELASLKNLTRINSHFPHQLEKLTEIYDFKLLHISTDGVFPNLSGRVKESSPVFPENNYGKSKLLGETTSSNSLTFRTSFVGLDSEKHRGLLEIALHQKYIFTGYNNQVWTGCTTLQFAQLCEDIVVSNRFDLLRKQSPLYHFAPLGPCTKYELLKIFLELINKNYQIRKGSGEKKERILITNYSKSLNIDKYVIPVNQALRELIGFEQAYS